MRQRIGRRLISIMLSVLMLVSLLPTAVFAEELQNQTTAGVTEQVGEGTGNTVENSNEDEDSIGTTVTTNEALAEAIAAAKDGDTITLGEGDFTTYGKTSPQKSLTFVGAGTGTVWTIGDLTKNVGGEGNGDCSFDGCGTITFQNMTLKSDGADYRGFIRISNTVVDNCTIDGKTAYWGYETAIFRNGTKFIAPEGDYALWDYSTKAMTFDGCTFNISGRGVNVYVEAGNAGSAAREVTVNDCTVNSTKESKAFLNIKNSTQAYDVTISGNNTVAGLGVNSTTNSALYQVEKTEITETSGKSVRVQEKAANGTLTTIYEVKAPVVDYIDLDTFIKWLENSSYSVDGANYTNNNAVVGGKLVVKWSPVSGCYDTREGHTCTAGGAIATGNTPKRVNNGLTQFQLFEGEDVAVTVKNVKFVYAPAAFTVCENSGWKGSFTAEQAPAGQLYFMTTGDVTFDSCEFDQVVLTTFNTTGSSTVTNCKFDNVHNNYAIKDIRGANVSVTGTTITNCGGGIMVSSTDKVEKVTIWKNTFTNVDVTGTAAEDKVGNRALIQIASTGDYSGTSFNLTANTATGCGPVLRQLNQTIVNSGKIDTVKSDVASLVKSGTKGLGTTDSLLEQSVPAGYVENEQGNVTISDEAGLFWFAKQVNEEGNTFAGKTVTLANDITLTKPWTPIGDFASDKAFKGTFDGQNHTVSGMQVTKYSTKGVGFFAKTFTATIKNLTVEGKITAYGCSYVGGIVGHGYATITNCTFKGTVTNQRGYQVGGIAGSGGFTITNCAVYGDISAESWVGGIVGNAQDGGAFTNCYVEGTISANSAYAGASAAGIAAIPLYKTQKIGGCYSNTVVKCGGEEINAPIIGAYNGDNNITAETELFIYDNSWNKQKNSNNSYSVSENGTVIEGKDVSRDNNLVMLEDDLRYVTDLSKVRIMPCSAVTQEKVDALAVAKIGDVGYITLEAAIAAAKAGETVKLLADVTADVTIDKNITLDLGGKTLTNTNAGKDTIFVSNGVTATVQNGTVKGGTGHYTIAVGTKEAPNGTLTLKNVTATAGNNGSSMIDNWGTLTIESGTYTGGLNVVKSEEGSKLTINGGKFECSHGVAYKQTAVILVYGDTTITGGEFIQSSTVIKASPQVVMTGIVDGYTATTKITGGKFENNAKSGTRCEIFWALGKATSDNFKVSGGTFNKSISDGFCADGFIPTKNADGTYGVKEGKYVAEIGSKKYETLADAIRLAAKGKTITLLANVTENVEIAATKKLTLDLNGFTLNGGTGTAKAALTNYGTITIKDSSDAQTGTIKRDDNGTEGETSYYVINNKGTMTIESGTVTNNSGYRKQNTSGSMVGSSLICNGDDDALTPVLNIKGGKFEQENFIAIKNGLLGTLNVSGGEISSKHSAIQNRYKATITAGTINGQLWTDAYVWDGGKSVGETKIGDNAEFNGEIVMDITGSNVIPKLEITGGKLNVTNWRITTAAATAGAKPAISGGTFTTAVPESYCAAGYIPTKNEDDFYGVKQGTYVAQVLDKNGNPVGSKYESLQAAIDAANRNATVKMLANTKANVTISTPYLTLDLNGFTLNGGTEKGKPALTVTARVTVKDSSRAQTGTIMREDTAENSGVSSHYVIDVQGAGWLTFESGIVKNNSGNAEGKGASLVRVGDDSIAKYPGLNIKGGTFTQNNFIVIKVDRGDLFLNGGTLNSDNSYAIEDWHRATIKGGTVNGTVAAWTYSGGHNSDLTISGGTVNGDVTSVNYGNADGKKATVAITGGTINGELDTRSYDPKTNKLTSISDATKATIEVTAGTFAKDPTKYVVEDSTVNKNTDGTFGVEKAYLAKVGETSYYTMDEAFKAQTASGEPIVMLRDYTTGSPFSSGSINRTVDLDGHTWTCTGTDANSAAFEINHPNVTLTVKNGTVVSSQLVGLIPSAMGGAITYDNSSLVFESVKMMTTAHSGIETNGNNTNDTVTLKDSTLNVPNGFGIYFPSSGTLTIDNSTINAKTMGVQVCAGSLSINDGSAITVTGNAVPKTENDGAIQDGAAISIVNRTGYKGLDKIEVTGGTFKANGTNAAIKAYGWANKAESDFDNSNGTIAITGGTFNAPVKPEYCAANHEPVKNADGTYGVTHFDVARIGSKVYETLQDAFNAVITTEGQQTIVLLHDVTVTGTLKFDKTYNDIPTILKMQGFTITGDGCRALQIVNGHLRIEGRSNEDTESIITSTGIGIASSVIRVGANDVSATSKQNLSLAMGVTVKTNCSYGIAVFGGGVEILSVENSKVISTAEHNADYDGCAIATLGTDMTSANVTIKDGAYIEAKDSNAIYMPSGSLLVYGNVGNYPTVTGLTGIYAKSGRVTIKGANIYGTGAVQEYIYNGNGGVPTGDALVIDNCGYPAGVPTVSFGDTNAPKFESTNAKPIGSYARDGYTKVTGFVDKGTFNKAIDKDLLKDGYVCVYNAETKNYGVATTKNCVAKVGDIYYATLQDAIDAAQNGATVVLVKDVDLAKTVVVNKTITLDMNGKKLHNTNEIWNDGNWSLISACGGNLTITGNGTFAAKENDCYAVDVQDGAKLVIKDGTFVGNIHAVYVFEGTATIDGGTYSVQQKYPDESKAYEFVLNCYDANRANGTAKIIVNGGTFQNFDPMNNQAEGKGTSFVAAGVGVDHVDGKFTAKSGMTAQVVDADGKSVKAFDKLSDALTAAKAGQTVKLLKRVNDAKYVEVEANVTLDLNGYNITDVKLLWVTGRIIDSAAKKGVVSATKYLLPANNGYAPVYNSEGDGYSFFDLNVFSDKTESGSGVWFRLGKSTERAAAVELMKANAEGRRIKAIVTVSWENGEEGSGKQSFEFADGKMATYLTDITKYAFEVTIGGLNRISGKITAQAQFVVYDAEGGAIYTIAGNNWTIQK